MKNIAHLAIYQDTDVLANVKETVCRPSRPRGKRMTHRFNVSGGDIPVFAINCETGGHEIVDNHRGKAYAARKRQMYRNDQDRRFKGGYID